MEHLRDERAKEVMTTSTDSKRTTANGTDDPRAGTSPGLPYPGPPAPREPRGIVALVAQWVLMLLGALGAYQIGRTINFGRELGDPWQYLAYAGAIAAGAVVGWVAGGLVARWLPSRMRAIDRAADTRSAGELIVGALGLVVGLVAAALAGVAVARLPVVGPYLLLPVVLLVAYVFTRIAARKHADILRLVGIRSRSASSVPPRLIDSSAIIDGRIIDVMRARFLPGQIVIPAFVVEELHRVADSADPEKRQRGRRGLDLVEEMKSVGEQRVQVRPGDVPGDGVDAKLVNLARDMHACIVTTDYALNKVARIQGVDVLNVNELAIALKPSVLPGERLEVRIIREGREYDQGVGYLDDGTMVVVEGARSMVGGDPMDVEVTSAIQNPSGKMIF
ncbi:MAG: PIN/TRAM domain-containing protein, partial [Miltoncostaeaceae bacterium]